MRRPSVLVLALLCAGLALPRPVRADAKKPSPYLQAILDAKRIGGPYNNGLWHAVDAEFRLARELAERSLADARRKDGGSSSANATPVTASPYVDAGTTVGKGNHASIPGCGGSNDTAEDAWYVVTFDFAVELDVRTTCASTGISSYDTRLAVFDASLNLVDCNDDDPNCGSPFFQSSIRDLALDAGTYYIVVDGWNGASGDYELNVTWGEQLPPCAGGSEASNATLVDTLPYFHSGDTTDDCDDVLVTCELGGSISGPDHWYELTVDTAVLLDVAVSCDAADIDSRIAVLSPGLSPIACNDDDPLCSTGQSTIVDALLPAGTYYVVVDGGDQIGGTYSVSIDTTHAPAGSVEDLLPDITVRLSDLYDHDIVTSVEPGRTHLRLSNGTPNIGDGKLYLYGVLPDNGDGTQNVNQRVFRSDGSFYDRHAGRFVYHPGHNHIHIEGWAAYRLHESLPGNSVGDVVAEGKKTSFCIIDLGIHDPSLPNFLPGGQFFSCGSTIQGLSVGWVDVYNKELSGQNIDITGLPDGVYWLEATVDPDDHILEKDENNNSIYIQVTIGEPAPGTLNPDAYEPNDDLPTVDLQREGGPNSPNLGPVGPQRVVPLLNVHEPDKPDLYRFYLPETGATTDFVRIHHASGSTDLALELLDEGGVTVASSDSSTTTETVPLTGIGRGYYYARVIGSAGGILPSYTLTLDPSENGAPSVAVTDPPVGGASVSQGFDSYTIRWNATDPEDNDTWVTVYLSEDQQLDGNDVLVPTARHTRGSMGMHVLNTAEVAPRLYWVYCEITDGGRSSGSWSPGPLDIVSTATGAPVPLSVARLLPGSPNPFNPATQLRLELNEASFVRWRIYDVRGARVKTLADGPLPTGTHLRVWDGRDDAGRFVASGVYIQVLDAAGVTDRGKLVLLK